MSRVALIEDNADFREEVRFHLDRAGFTVVFQGDGREMDAIFPESDCDLVVLDLGLPGIDGLDVARRLRRTKPSLGIVIITARGGLTDRISGLQNGADAYLSKPVDMRELVAVLESVERRVMTSFASSETDSGHWTLRPPLLVLESPAGVRVSLTPTEVALLRCLADEGDAPASREALASAMGHPEPDFDFRRLEVALSRLRSKIDSDAPNSRVIRSARKRGYVFAAPLRVDPGMR